MSQPRQSSSLSVSSLFAAFSTSAAHGDRPHGHGAHFRRFLRRPFLSEVDMLPTPSNFVCDGHFTSSGLFLVASCNVAPFPSDCSVSRFPTPCVCPACNSQSPSFLNFFHFQHFCCVSSCGGSCRRIHDLSPPPRLTLLLYLSPAAVNAFTTNVWLGQSTPAAVLSDPLLTASSFEHLNFIDFNAPPVNSSLNSSCVPDGMPHPPPIFPLCYTHSCGLQISNPLMTAAWNCLVITASSAWVLQWVRRSCGSSTSCRTSLLLPQSRVLNALLLRLSSLTSPLDALFVSASPRCLVHDPFSLSGNGQGAARR